MDLHLSLKAERERQHVTAADMAAYIGVSEDQVRRYDSGRTEISLRTAARYAERLGRQLGDILPSTRVRAPELRELLAALEDFDPAERAEVIHKLTRDATWLSARLNDRVARRTDTDE